MSTRAMASRGLRGCLLAIAFCFVPVASYAADPFPSSSCAGLTGFQLTQCEGIVTTSAQLAALQISIDAVSGLAGTLSAPLTAISSFWTEELLFFFLGVGLAFVFVRAVGSKW